MRTTLDIDDPILKDLKELQAQEGKSLGRLASDLLAQAISEKRKAHTLVSEPAFHWHAQSMTPRLDLADKDALLDAMDDPKR
ncbi:MAG: antitoxin [Burkholderiaceae bacterium]|nr:antitoxin [Burkholderiaceae bacterium]